MNTLADQFIEFCVNRNVLQFGDFQLRSGRKSPYFFNFGALNDGESLFKLGQYYAEKIIQSGIDFDMLFGPAYKGIPIATTTAVALYHRYQRSVKVGFNRKEAKSHAEKGLIMGHAPQGRILLVDDVLTSGQACGEVIGFLERDYPESKIAGLVVGLDRQEKSSLRDQTDICAIARLDDAIRFVENSPEYCLHLQKMQEYYQHYAQ